MHVKRPITACLTNHWHCLLRRYLLSWQQMIVVTLDRYFLYQEITYIKTQFFIVLRFVDRSICDIRGKATPSLSSKALVDLCYRYASMVDLKCHITWCIDKDLGPIQWQPWIWYIHVHTTCAQVTIFWNILRGIHPHLLSLAAACGYWYLYILHIQQTRAEINMRWIF